ncbi:hypothetical protein CCACVL1_04117 [Corchorus capsularis]|uniref:MHD domain-containing protein n=1 Tax=Corchorus capsularis TaxID=210143 RepID=A0A1R3JV09_COCAP|nr:hypothetical protein CCACVL1_04117 [Corchorus capsularis]
MVLYNAARIVEIAVPVPGDASILNVKTSMGFAYAPENDGLMWKIGSIPGGKVKVSLLVHDGNDSLGDNEDGEEENIGGKVENVVGEEENIGGGDDEDHVS